MGSGLTIADIDFLVGLGVTLHLRSLISPIKKKITLLSPKNLQPPLMCIELLLIMHKGLTRTPFGDPCEPMAQHTFPLVCILSSTLHGP